jgi:hypothetical protein
VKFIKTHKILDIDLIKKFKLKLIKC